MSRVLIVSSGDWSAEQVAKELDARGATEEYIFLECNAAGQWGWLAAECGLPIAEAIADELTGYTR